MRLDPMPTLLLSNISRSSAAATQRQLAEAQVEVSSGRHSDMGLWLGSQIGSDIRLRLQLAETAQSHDLLSQAGAKAGATQSVLESVSKLTANFLQVITGARSAADGRDIARSEAQTSREAFADLINTSFAGQYLFSGLNTGTPPLTSLDDKPLGRLAQSFETEFGIALDDPAAAGISGSQMSAFLDGSFADLFDEDSWKADWSRATGVNQRSRLSGALSVDTSSNANTNFIPKLAQALMMMASLGEAKLSDGAFQAMTDRAIKLVSESQLEIGTEQARIGSGQARLTSAVEALDARKTSLTSAINGMEAVDPYEAATRVNQLMTQLETSYAVTGRISRLSLLSYI